MILENKKYPNRLREIRFKHGYSYKRVARFLGVNNQNVITRWEEGASLPSLEHFLKILYLYDATPNELYEEYYQTLREQMNTLFEKFVCPIFDTRSLYRSRNDTNK